MAERGGAAGPADTGYTRWSVVGAGEAGCRIAAYYFATHANLAISDRILLLNSAAADITNLLKNLEQEIQGDDAARRLQMARDNKFVFGTKAGSGNWFLNGEHTLEENWDETARYLERVLGNVADVIVHLCGLGGGTGNGSVPLMIYKMHEGKLNTIRPDAYQFAVGVWPYPDEANHRQINAIMGLSRLLRFGPRSEANADFVLLLGNHQLASIAKTRGIGSGTRFQDLNQVAARILNALISPGQGSLSVIDARDYAINRQRFHMQHFTAGVAWDVPKFLKLEEALNEALANLMMKVDASTSISAYLILQVPPEDAHDPAFAPGEVESVFHAWCQEKKIRAEMRFQSVVPDATLQGSYHVILFFGGFDLTPLVIPYAPIVERHVQVLSKGFGGGAAEAEQIKELWRNLVEYVEVTNENRRVFQG